MKKMLPIFTITFLLLVTPAVASKGKVPEKEEITENQQETVCDPDDNWKNHGKYVSCVAKLRLGGKVTSEAAKSDIGKKEEDDEDQEDQGEQDDDQDDDDDDEATPSASPSVSPSASPGSSPSATPGGSPSASPSASPAANVTEAVSLELKALIKVLQNILTSLQKLI